MFEIGKRKPFERLSREQRELLKELSHFCKHYSIPKDTLAGCMGLANWKTFASTRKKDRRLKAMIELTQAIKRAKINHELNKTRQAA